MKQLILGTSLGRAATRARAKIELLSAARETLGTVANDQLAEQITTRWGGRFLDIGAHIGSIIAAVRYHDPQSRISAVEAIPEKAERLRQKFPFAEIHCCALSDREGEASFFIDLEKSGYSGLSAGRKTREIKVPLRTLDSLLPEAKFDFIKIDVEGAEEGVLKGSSTLVERCRPLIMFESGPGEVLGYTKKSMWQWFDDRRYGLFVPNRLAHTAPPMSLEVFLDSHAYPRRTTNYFAVPEERGEEIRDRARHL